MMKPKFWLYEKQAEELISFEEIKLLLDSLDDTEPSHKVMPLVLEAEFSICYGFLPQEFADLCECSDFTDTVCSILNDMNKEKEDHLYTFVNDSGESFDFGITRNLSEIKEYERKIKVFSKGYEKMDEGSKDRLQALLQKSFDKEFDT